MDQISMRNEMWRKLVHLALLLIPLIYFQLGKHLSLALFTSATVIFVTLDYFRHKNPAIKNIFMRLFGNLLRPKEIEENKLCGASWVGISACINFLIFKPEIAATAFVVLAICDTCAAIIGRSFVSEPFFEKSLIGSSAFFVSGIIVVITCAIIFHQGFWFYLFGFLGLFFTTIIEARPSLFKLDDNFTIPLSFALFMSFFDLVWNYTY